MENSQRENYELERELNIKTIIFSEMNYSAGDELNVLQCGQLNDPILEQNGIFEPSFYVMIAHHRGYHYQIITYILRYTLQYDIEYLILKCN